MTTITLEREEYDTLVAERDYWKAEAQCDVATRKVVAIARVFDLTLSEAWIVGALHDARGEVVRTARLDEDRPVERNGKHWEERETGNNTLAVLICRIRKKVGHDRIEVVRGQGYRMTEDLMRRIDAFAQKTAR